MNRNFVQNRLNSKSQLRKELLERRLALAESFVEKVSLVIAQKVVSLGQIKRARNISVYLPIRNEVETRTIIDYLVSVEKNIYLPTFNQRSKKYFFSLFAGWQNLEPGPYGTLQPTRFRGYTPGVQDAYTPGVNLDLAIFPGVAFDKKGVRLGYGKGVFDQLFAKSSAFKIGLAYDFQIVDKLPKDAHDLVMDLVVTEKGVI